jgi:hypothetical protein
VRNGARADAHMQLCVFGMVFLPSLTVFWRGSSAFLPTLPTLHVLDVSTSRQLEHGTHSLLRPEVSGQP